VPVRIKVSEAKWRELRIGPTLDFEPGESSVAVQASYRDDNVGRRLWRTEADATLGVGALVATSGQDPGNLDLALSRVAPVGDVKARVELPRLGGTDVSLSTEARAVFANETGYRLFQPSLAPTLVYEGFRKLRPSVGYRLEYTNAFDLTVPFSEIEDSRFRVDVTNPYLLSMLEQKLVYDGRNDPLSATRGWYWSAAFAEAGLGGNATFVRGDGEVRAYRGVVDVAGWDPELVFAGRVGGGLVVPLGDDANAGVPPTERLFLGGSTTVRGWGADRLGPYVCDAPPVGEESNYGPCNEEISLQVPVGGELRTYGSLEVRKGLPLDLVLALFTDVGGVWDRPSRFALGGLQWSVGAGLRYPTPVGPIRFDVGVHLDPSAYYAAHQWAAHLALGEAF